ncbi:Ig-like domain-containing protein, partial [Brevibacillus choshinensis]|uniref:Ig-like domain-containing protein n=1 Tax=Brevibacillus choshinensis TaxID=54911 RepID=UPI002E1C1565|nr:Ig-like domain-containing protein [Brevibacillus choshinensis]
AINAKQLEIKFTKAVDESTVIGAASALSTNITIAAAESTANAVASFTAKLSADGKTLTVTPNTYFNGKYSVNVSTSVEDEDGNAVEAYTTIVNANDTTRPVVSAPAYPVNNIARFALSEPINANAGAVEAAMTIKDATGATVSSATLVTAVNDDSFDLNIGGFAVNKDYTVTLVGLKDYKGNLISPNPVTFTVKNTTVDDVNPAVQSLVATKATQLQINFSEKVADQGLGVVGTYDIGAGPVNINITAGTGNATVDSTGKVVTVNAAGFTGVKTVTVDGYEDLSGNPGDAFTKVLNFVADTTDPKVVSSAIEKIDGVEYLVVTFDENVTPIDDIDITGKVVKNFVESAVTLVTDEDGTATATGSEINAPISQYKPVSGVSKAVKVDLSNLTDGSYTLNLPVGLVQDEATNDNEAKAGVTFTRGTNSVKPKLTATGTNGILKVDNTTYTVNFDSMLDAATALNTANYAIEGVEVTNAIFTQNDASGAVVKLTVKPNSVSLTGERAVTVANVKSSAGVVMDTVNTTEVITENVAPTIAKAELTAANVITLTFSESVSNVNAAHIDAFVDTTQEVETGSFAVAAVGASTTQYTVTLADDLTADELAKALTVKLVVTGTSDIVDANGNKADAATVTVNK